MAARNSPATLRANMEQLFGPTTDPARLARREEIIESRIQRVLATPPEEAAVSLGIGFPDVESDEELEAMLSQSSYPDTDHRWHVRPMGHPGGSAAHGTGCPWL